MSGGAQAQERLQQQIAAQNEAAVKGKSETASKSGLGVGFGLDIKKGFYFDLNDFMADNTVSSKSSLC